MIKQIIFQVGTIIFMSAILSPIVWLGWNFGVTKFIPVAPLVQWWDALILMLVGQSVTVFSLRKVDIRYIPIYLPTSALAHQAEEKISEE